MNAEIGEGFFFAEVIGDFPEKEARQFAEYTLGRAGKESHLTDDDWHEVYEVRHGSNRRVPMQVLLLILLASNYQDVSHIQ